MPAVAGVGASRGPGREMRRGVPGSAPRRRRGRRDTGAARSGTGVGRRVAGVERVGLKPQTLTRPRNPGVCNARASNINSGPASTLDVCRFDPVLPVASTTRRADAVFRVARHFGARDVQNPRGIKEDTLEDIAVYDGLLGSL